MFSGAGHSPYMARDAPPATQEPTLCDTLLQKMCRNCRCDGATLPWGPVKYRFPNIYVKSDISCFYDIYGFYGFLRKIRKMPDWM